jgi:hypothetical protein
MAIDGVSTDITKAAKEAMLAAVLPPDWHWDTAIVSDIMIGFNGVLNRRGAMGLTEYMQLLEEVRYYGIKSLTDTRKLTGPPLSIYTHVIEYLYKKMSF